MANMKPFRCIRPGKEVASQVAALPYDVYNRQEAVLDNGERILIARRRYEAFGQEMLAYMRKNGGIL